MGERSLLEYAFNELENGGDGRGQRVVHLTPRAD